jgi:hypothetical protein
MPRPPRHPPKRSEFAAEEHADYDDVASRRLKSVLFEVLLWWPAYAANRKALSTLVRSAGERGNTYTHVDRELVDQVLMPHMKTNHVARVHIPDALASGVRLEAIEALRKGRDEDLTDDERVIVEFTRQVVDGTVTDESWNAIEKRMGTRGAVEFTIFITILMATLRQYQAFGLTDVSDEEVDAILREHREGKRKPTSDYLVTKVKPEWLDSKG